jgi:hypothetical protein
MRNGTAAAVPFLYGSILGIGAPFVVGGAFLAEPDDEENYVIREKWLNAHRRLQ